MSTTTLFPHTRDTHTPAELKKKKEKMSLEKWPTQQMIVNWSRIQSRNQSSPIKMGCKIRERGRICNAHQNRERQNCRFEKKSNVSPLFITRVCASAAVKDKEGGERVTPNKATSNFDENSFYVYTFVTRFLDLVCDVK
jgi:hypothetical protein